MNLPRYKAGPVEYWRRSRSLISVEQTAAFGGVSATPSPEALASR